MRESKRRMVSGDRGRHGIEEPDCCAEERRSNCRESDLADRKGRGAGKDGDNDRADHARPAVVGDERGGDACELCGVSRYGARARPPFLVSTEADFLPNISLWGRSPSIIAREA